MLGPIPPPFQREKGAERVMSFVSFQVNVFVEEGLGFSPLGRRERGWFATFATAPTTQCYNQNNQFTLLVEKQVICRVLIMELLRRRFGLTNYQEGVQLRAFGIGRYLPLVSRMLRMCK